MSSSATTGGEGNINVTVTVSNTGSMDGDEVRVGVKDLLHIIFLLFL